MKNYIYVFWYKDLKAPNFGDEINPYLIKRLSGLKVIHVPIVDSFFKSILKGGYYWFKRKITFKGLFYTIKSVLFNSNILVGIGSILKYPQSRRAIVWGAGVISVYDKVHNAQFLVVRGRETQKIIERLGYESPKVLGDPALLLPLVYQSKNEKKYKLGIIPHYINYEQAKLIFENNNQIKIINLFDNIEDVIADICSCEMTISSSLHGIIVSHAYGVPSLWCVFDKKLAGDNIKFRDYFSSINLNYYDPFIIKDKTCDELLELFSTYYFNVIPNVDLTVVQRKLLKVAPFPVLESYVS